MNDRMSQLEDKVEELYQFVKIDICFKYKWEAFKIWRTT